MIVKFRIRRDTSANWTANNPVLALGEPGLETDTRKVKYGDGTAAWNSLPYSAAGAVAWTDITGKPTTVSGYGIADALVTTNNLSDLANVATARANLGIGTYLEATLASGSAISLTSATAADVVYVDLTVGTWAVDGAVGFLPGGATVTGSLSAYITTVSATAPARPNGGAIQTIAASYANGANQSLASGRRIITVASGTTRVYLGARAIFSADTLSAFGHILATRIS